MARSCAVCGKTSFLLTVLKKLRGKWNPTTKQRKYPNLQWMVVGANRVKACVKCMRTANKAKTK
ncbi:hypothetical protein A3C91_03175 [Candidatus Azambacteria bacterium RIFCSPHIGHO2_02_FULL_52_12]|uniref:50S ribosomal protein L28 n=1 Tax=Candidatus Azambacteria bacterium RIFCSPLOWO2_01_FULL_46_25 TaxID=1797298 RepID=A0A1F5BU62_9BACT|nr:MAG: hypothetical protein A3C91_03175 [Candidatus Azambacteria bacterium RIFCSPHIGHO2_02_FULL_52_12]OGD34151.1 MAG: hypothetical protein A2988_01580 [Candidatus Azambacteria bacterium RIFCSPLOWO2_01_FULL_46_25]OGD36750.1 MAG: hypothetical protein A2850_00535 [Candidatus Azambacteria bacterium RIFCSPHIGHO2_01_FULL_51_74]